MNITSVQKKIKRTAEDQARLKAVREKFQRERPTQEDVRAAGNVPVPLGAYLELKHLLHDLKQERLRRGLSLSQVSKRSGIDKAALSRMENGLHANPTVDTLWKLAAAVGKQVVWLLTDQPAPTRRPRSGRLRGAS